MFLKKSGAAARALQLPRTAEACKNHLRETFRSFDTKGIKLSLLQSEVKLAGPGRSGRGKGLRSVNPGVSGSI
jgi:hypothetical protein